MKRYEDMTPAEQRSYDDHNLGCLIVIACILICLGYLALSGLNA